MRNLFLILALLMLTTATWAGNKAAVVKLIKGEAYVVSGDKKVKLNVNDWLETGSVLHTSAKSFVKLVFIDKSQMNVGPQSEIKIEKFHTKDAGVIDLVKGKIRSQVSKDYLQINGKDRSKLFIKTNNSVMGIRGTDFMITTNGKNTAAILFEGEVVFNRLSDKRINNSAKLDEIVDRGVRMFPGEFSAVGESGPPTIPALLSVSQKEKLEKNESFSDDARNSKVEITKSIVPGGLEGKVVSSEPKLDTPSPKGSNQPPLVGASNPSSKNPETYLKQGQIKPANGSMLHIDSATIIAPGAGAVLDKNSNTYIAADSSGVINKDGTYIPPVGVEINADGNLLVTSTDGLKTSEVSVESPIIAIQTAVTDAGSRTEQLIYTVVDYKEEIAKTGSTTTATGSTDGGTITGSTTSTGGTTTGGTTTGGTTTGGTSTGGTTTGPAATTTTDSAIINTVQQVTSGVMSGGSKAVGNLIGQ